MRHRAAWKQVLKALAGVAAGLLLWLGFSGVYRAAVLPPTELALHLIESPDVTDLRGDDRAGVIVDRRDFPRESPRPGIPLQDLTFNVILLFALFALSVKPFSNENVGGLCLSLMILWPTHVLALLVRIQKIYALQLGEWSQVHYGVFSRNLWASLDHFYRVVGMYAIAFALWWVFRGDRRRGGRSRR